MKEMLREQKALAEKKKREKKKAQMQQMVKKSDERASPTSAGPSLFTKKRAFAEDSFEKDEDSEVIYGKKANEAWNKESNSESAISDLADMGISPIYDPTEKEEPQVSVDLSDLNKFLTSPVPDGVTIQCYVNRNKGGFKNMLYPKYELFMKDEDVFLLAAKKRSKNKTSNYIVSKERTDLSKESPNFMGKVRANFLGTEFTLYDDGASPSSFTDVQAEASTANIRSELGVVFYKSNILGSRGPRKMDVILPKISRRGKTKVWKPLAEDESMAAAFKRGDTNGMMCLENKSPKWNDQVGAYVLNFNGRVTMASVKNFQLIDNEDPDNVIMQFGRVAKDKFNVDFGYPLSPLQAFMIVLSSFDYKIACE